MDRNHIAQTLVRLARELVAAPKLTGKELAIAKKMKAKGYNYAIQITTVDGDFGEPMYFKDSGQVGPFLRGFPDYKNAKTKWVIKLDDIEE